MLADFARFLAVVVALARVVPPLYLGRPDRGARLREALQGLRGLWVKVGQALSVRHDLVPADICDALSLVQGRVPGLPGIARQIVARELGSLDMFVDVSDDPVAAASVGQVHRWRLRSSGQWVAVKLLYPDVRERYARDLRVLTVVARVLTVVAPRLKAMESVRELRAVLDEELDLRYEANHMARMRPLLKKQGISTPRVFDAYCTADMLVCEWMPGIVMSDLLRLSPERRLAWFRQHGSNPTKVAKKLLRSLLTQVLEENRYHGDLHPGNIILSAGNAVSVLDFGTTSATEADFLARFVAFVRALTTRNYARAADLFCLLCVWPPRGALGHALDALLARPGHGALRTELVTVMQRWVVRTEIAALPFHDKSIMRLTTDLMRVVLRWRGTMQWAWIRLSRALTSLDGTLAVLWPSIDYVREARKYLRSAEKRVKLARINPAVVLNRLVVLLDRIDEYGQIETASLRLEGLMKGL